MSKIVHDLLPKMKSYKRSLEVEIDLYPYAIDLYAELERIGIIERTKEIPQLGTIKVSSKLEKTRYDYIMLQLYLHQLIKKNLQGQLRLTYNNAVKAKEFSNNFSFNKKDEKPTIGDILQLLIIVYNIGHFYNTFTASRAVTMLASEDKNFYDMILNASGDERFKTVAVRILNDKNYQRFHLLNSILILERCNNANQAVSLAKEILYAYINENSLLEESKLKYAFNIYKSVRTISYMAYDLQIADTPLIIDLCNEKAMLLILRELLSEYNNNQSSTHLVNSITKLLDDTVYNENSNAICYYKISRRMVYLLSKESGYRGKDYYAELFFKKNSLLNKSYVHRRDYIQSQILKLTFEQSDRELSELLLSELERINNTRVGYYDRHTGEQTILVSIKNSCDAVSKRVAAFKTMKSAINLLRKIPDIQTTDNRFLLCAKFFLFYLFDENPVVIKATIDRKRCVICTRGKNARIKEIQGLLDNSVGTKDENHEISFMLNQLKQDTTNDTSISIPASVLVYKKDAVGRKLSEFDGLLIHPMRKKEQVVFFEAKNTSNRPAYGKNCLKEKLDKFSFQYDIEDIKVINYDAVWKLNI